MTSTQIADRTVRTVRMARTDRAEPHATQSGYAALPRRERAAVSYCSIWDLVAPGDPCPACEDTFEDRLARARSGDL